MRSNVDRIVTSTSLAHECSLGDRRCRIRSPPTGARETRVDTLMSPPGAVWCAQMPCAYHLEMLERSIDERTGTR
jgi:hypothetical protein